MNSKITEAYWQSGVKSHSLDNFKISIHVESNPLQIPLDTLFAMASRDNPKRPFLFVSKILGKHIPVKPFAGLLGGALLACRYLEVVYGVEMRETKELVQALANQIGLAEAYQKLQAAAYRLPELTQFIGFAETATGLGHSMFAGFAANGLYLQTTREHIPQMPRMIDFREEHSHAVLHHCYLQNLTAFRRASRVVLVDDEITTGKTALNIIKELHQVFPHKNYVVASLLDWRSTEDIRQYSLLAEQLGISIQTVSLVSGKILVAESPRQIMNNFKDTQGNTGMGLENGLKVEQIALTGEWGDFLVQPGEKPSGKDDMIPYLAATGRFGINTESQQTTYPVLARIGRQLGQTRQGKKTLCLGTGEFIYLPMVIAAYMGEGVWYHSTTRSPIIAGSNKDYPVQNAFSFPSPHEPGVTNYLYNVPAGYYDEVYLFFERAVPDYALEPLLEIFRRLAIPRLFVVACVGGKNEGGKEMHHDENYRKLHGQ